MYGGFPFGLLILEPLIEAARGCKAASKVTRLALRIVYVMTSVRVAHVPKALDEDPLHSITRGVVIDCSAVVCWFAIE